MTKKHTFNCGSGKASARFVQCGCVPRMPQLRAASCQTGPETVRLAARPRFWAGTNSQAPPVPGARLKRTGKTAWSSQHYDKYRQGAKSTSMASGNYTVVTAKQVCSRAGMTTLAPRRPQTPAVEPWLFRCLKVPPHARSLRNPGLLGLYRPIEAQ